jgi:hypothetical protein
MLHSQRHGLPYPAELPGGAAAGGGGSGGGLILTVTATAAGPTARLGAAPTTIVTAPAVTVAAGQKVIVWTAVEYDAASDDGGNDSIQQTIKAGATTYDTCNQTIVDGAPNVNSQTVGRTVELVGLAPGAYAFFVAATDARSALVVTASNASIVVALVSA